MTRTSWCFEPREGRAPSPTTDVGFRVVERPFETKSGAATWPPRSICQFLPSNASYIETRAKKADATNAMAVTPRTIRSRGSSRFTTFDSLSNCSIPFEARVPTPSMARISRLRPVRL